MGTKDVVLRLSALAAACTVGFTVAAGPSPIVPERPHCGDRPGLQVSPQYDRTRPGPTTPIQALEPLVTSGHAGWLTDLSGVTVDLVEGIAGPDAPHAAHSADGSATDRDLLVVRNGAVVLALVEVVPHPAGGWMVDGLRSCAVTP